MPQSLTYASYYRRVSANYNNLADELPTVWLREQPVVWKLHGHKYYQPDKLRPFN